jgi:hypothetical protein
MFCIKLLINCHNKCITNTFYIRIIIILMNLPRPFYQTLSIMFYNLVAFFVKINTYRRLTEDCVEKAILFR